MFDDINRAPTDDESPLGETTFTVTLTPAEAAQVAAEFSAFKLMALAEGTALWPGTQKVFNAFGEAARAALKNPNQESLL